MPYKYVIYNASECYIGLIYFQGTSGEALVREMKEEFGVERFLCVAECFFDFEGKSFHELGFYYLMKFPESCKLYSKTQEFDGFEQSYRLIFKWYPLDKLDELELYPVFLKQKLLDLSDGIVLKRIRRQGMSKNEYDILGVPKEIKQQLELIEIHIMRILGYTFKEFS